MFGLSSEAGSQTLFLTFSRAILELFSYFVESFLKTVRLQQDKK